MTLVSGHHLATVTVHSERPEPKPKNRDSEPPHRRNSYVCSEGPLFCYGVHTLSVFPRQQLFCKTALSLSQPRSASLR